MKKIACVIVFILTSILLFVGCTNNKQEIKTYDMTERLIALHDNVDFSDIAEAVAPACLGVSCVVGSSQSVGSGVCVAKDGYVLTNSHVINGGSDVKLYLYDGTTADADIIYEDTVMDIAILKSSKNLPYLSMKNTDDVKVGEDVLAVGTPISLTLTHTFTKGIVSALNRTLKVSSSAGVGYMQNMIQHDASLNPGNSGGPVLDKTGQVIGINTLKISGGEGIGFAIPIKSVASLIQSFAMKVNYQLPYLGVFGYDASIANYYEDTKEKNGFYVESVSDERVESFKKGDVIKTINGSTVDTALDLRNILYSFSANDVIDVEFVRNGEKCNTKIKLSIR